MWNFIRSIALVVAGILPAAEIALAQATPGILQFDVVSVKPNVGNAQQNVRVSPGCVAVTNVPLKTLIQFAYQVQPRELMDAPDWITTERFDQPPLQGRRRLPKPIVTARRFLLLFRSNSV